MTVIGGKRAWEDCRDPTFTLRKGDKMIKTIGLMSVLAMGCAVDAGPDAADPSDDVGTVPSDGTATPYTSSWTVAHWERTTNIPVDKDYFEFGSTSDHTCFLSGLIGSMESAYGSPEPPNTLYTAAAAGVLTDGASYEMEALSGVTGVSIGARAVCPQTVDGRTAIKSWTGGASAVLLAPSAGYICGLVEVYQPADFQHPQVFTGDGDQVHIFESGGNFYLGGTGNAAASARCVKVTAKTSADWVLASTSGSHTIDLAQGADKQCFLTGLQGSWQGNNLTTGAWIDRDAGLLQWTLTVTGNKKAWARCMI